MIKHTAYENCLCCRGYGVCVGGSPMYNMPEDTGECQSCEGSGFQRIRDEKGRFAINEKPRRKF